ncbi:hypothetical protein GIB67_013355, partial [Kingdonia uniflora]
KYQITKKDSESLFRPLSIERKRAQICSNGGDLVLDTAIRDVGFDPSFFSDGSIGVLRYFVLKTHGIVSITRCKDCQRRVRKDCASPKGQAQNPQAQMFRIHNMAMDMMKEKFSQCYTQVLLIIWIKGFVQLILGEQKAHCRHARTMQMSGLVDPSKLCTLHTYLFYFIKYYESYKFPFSYQSLSAEKDNLDIIQHEWALPKIEQRAEAVLRKLIS